MNTNASKPSIPRSSTTSMLVAALLCASVAGGCVVEEEPATDAIAAESPGAPGGKADSPFTQSGGVTWEEIAARCTPPAEDEPVLYSNDFHWNYSREEMAAREAEVYVSGKRLFERARYDADTQSFTMPITESWGGTVTLPKRLVENVTLHIQGALEHGYADHVFFPDMGHSHYFIPQDHWDAEYAAFPIPETGNKLSRLLDDPKLLVLYHTAEQLQMLDEENQVLPDPWIQYRHQTRNVVGDNDYLGQLETLQNPESAANTARDYPGDYYYYGAGFNVSASKDGCFPYVQDGELKWYDLSLSDLPYKSDGGGGDWR